MFLLNEPVSSLLHPCSPLASSQPRTIKNNQLTGSSLFFSLVHAKPMRSRISFIGLRRVGTCAVCCCHRSETSVVGKAHADELFHKQRPSLICRRVLQGRKAACASLHSTCENTCCRYRMDPRAANECNRKLPSIPDMPVAHFLIPFACLACPMPGEKEQGAILPPSVSMIACLLISPVALNKFRIWSFLRLRVKSWDFTSLDLPTNLEWVPAPNVGCLVWAGLVHHTAHAHRVSALQRHGMPARSLL